jgi:hypothetical protein
MREIEKIVEGEGYRFEVNADLDPDFSSIEIYDNSTNSVDYDDLPRGIKELADEYTHIIHSTGLRTDYESPMFLKGESSLPMTEDQKKHQEFIKETIDDLSNKAPGAAPVIIIPTIDDAADYLAANGETMRTIQSVLNTPSGWAFWSADTKTVYFIATRTPASKDAITETWMHEQIGHMGLSLIIPDKAQRYAFLSNVYKWAGNERIMEVIGDEYANETDAQKAAEYIAFTTGKILDGETLRPKDRTVWQKIKEYIKHLFDKLFKGKGITDYDIARIIHAMLTKVMAPAQSTIPKPETAAEMLLYHGSGQNFNDFASDRTNNKVSGMDYGYGVYLTSEPGIARFYANQLANDSKYFRDAYAELKDNSSILDKAVFYSGGNEAMVKQWLQDKADTFSDDRFMAAKYRSVLNYIEQNPIPPLRYIYSVSLHNNRTPGNWNYLDYYKPLTTDQVNSINNILTKEGFQQVNRMTGKVVYQKIAQMTGSSRAASELLLRSGIDGITYPSSQLYDNSETGTNYVIFDDSQAVIENHVSFRKGEAIVKEKIDGEPMLKTKSDRFIQFIQNNLLTVQKLQDLVISRGGTVSEDSNVILAADAAASKAREKGIQYHQKQFEPLLETIKGIIQVTEKTHKDETVEKLDQYLRAKHSPERNKVMYERNGREQNADFATDEANQIVAEYESLLSKDQIDALWKQINQATEFTLKKNLESGYLSPDGYKTIQKMDYKYYVPLRNFKEKIDEIFDFQESERSSGGLQGLKKAKGRTSESGFVLANIQAMAHTAILLAEKNAVKRAAANLVLANKSMKDLFRFVVVYTVDTLEKDSDGNPITYETIEKPDKELWDNGQVSISKNISHEVRLPASLSKQRVVPLMINGQKVLLAFTDPAVANAINKNNDFMPAVALGMKKSVGQLTRWLVANFTAKNPAFIPINMIRDVGYATVAQSIKYGTAGEFLGNLNRSRKAIIRYHKGIADPINNNEDDLFGISTSLSGDTLAVGSQGEDSNQITIIKKRTPYALCKRGVLIYHYLLNPYVVLCCGNSVVASYPNFRKTVSTPVDVSSPFIMW